MKFKHTKKKVELYSMLGLGLATYVPLDILQLVKQSRLCAYVTVNSLFDEAAASNTEGYFVNSAHPEMQVTDLVAALNDADAREVFCATADSPSPATCGSTTAPVSDNGWPKGFAQDQGVLPVPEARISRFFPACRCRRVPERGGQSRRPILDQMVSSLRQGLPVGGGRSLPPLPGEPASPTLNSA